MFMGFLREFNFYSTDWKVFKNQLENFFVVNNISDTVKKRALFLNILDSESYKLLVTLCMPECPEDTPFDALLDLFKQEFTPGDSIVGKRLKFYHLKKDDQEDVDSWAKRVESAAENCKFGDDADFNLKKKFISGFEDINLYKYLEENIHCPFSELLQNISLVKEKHECNCKKTEFDYGYSNWLGQFYPSYFM